MSSEIEELVGFCARVLVFRNGGVFEELGGAAMTADRILAAMFGQTHAQHGAEAAGEAPADAARGRRRRGPQHTGKTAMTRYSTLTQLDADWIVSWAKTRQRGPGLQGDRPVLHRQFRHRHRRQGFLHQVRNGKIEMVADEPNANLMGWQFALRAPASSWNKFVEPVPPPMFNDIWAMAHPLHGKLKIEGDMKIFWQNLRALTWMLAKMRPN